MEAWPTVPKQAITEGDIDWSPGYREAVNQLRERYYAGPSNIQEGADYILNAMKSGGGFLPAIGIPALVTRRAINAIGRTNISKLSKPELWQLNEDAYVALKKKSIGGKISAVEEEMFRNEHRTLIKKAQEKGLISNKESLDIFATMKKVKPSSERGDLVYLPDLYRELISQGHSKEQITDAIWKLAKAEKVQLQATSAPRLGAGWHPAEDEAFFIPRTWRGETRYLMAIGKRTE